RLGFAASPPDPAGELPEAALFEAGAGPPLLQRIVAFEDQLVAHPSAEIVLLEEPPQVFDLSRLPPLNRLAEPLDDLSADEAVADDDRSRGAKEGHRRLENPPFVAMDEQRVPAHLARHLREQRPAIEGDDLVDPRHQLLARRAGEEVNQDDDSEPPAEPAQCGRPHTSGILSQSALFR